MKRFLLASLTALVLAASLIFTVSADSSVTVTLNGDVVDCASYGQEATIVEGRTLVPLRAIFEALGASVEWDQTTKTVTSTLDETTVKLTIGENILYKNGEAIELDVPAQIMNDRTLVPARAVAESFGVKVDWDASTRTVILEKPYQRGTLDGNVYKSEWMGIAYLGNDDIVFFSEDEIDALMDFSGGYFTDPETGKQVIDYAKIVTVYEFFASDIYGNNINVMSEIIDSDITARTYLESAISAYELMDVECSEPVFYDTVIAGKNFECADITVNVYGREVVQSVAVKIADGRAFAIAITLVDKNRIDLMDGFVDISELEEGEDDKKAQEPVTDNNDNDETAENEGFDEDEIPEEAVEVLKKYCDASIHFNMSALSECCIDTYGADELGIESVEDALEYFGLDAESFAALMMEEAYGSDAMVPESMKAITVSTFKAFFDFTVEGQKACYYEIIGAKVIDENRIDFEIVDYMPDTPNVDDIYSEAYTVAMENAMMPDSTGENQMLTAEAFAEEFEKVLREMLLAKLENCEYVEDEAYCVSVYKMDDGKWLVEIPEDDAEVLIQIKNKDMDALMFGSDDEDLDGVKMYGDFYFGMTRDECEKAIKSKNVEVNEDDDFYGFIIMDEEGIYDDEDEEITGDANCSYIMLFFYEKELYSAYIVTDIYDSKEKAEKVMDSIIEYYGFEYELCDDATYTWTYGALEIIASLCEEAGEYYCTLEITDWS